MKKILFILFIIIFISSSRVQSHDQYLYLKNDFSYDNYFVSIDGLDTNNFLSYFNNVNVISVYPFVNPIYTNIIGNVSYDFKSNDLYNEINSFKNNYLALIKKNSYSDYGYLYINGINISKVLVYISGNDLYNFLILNNAFLIK